MIENIARSSAHISRNESIARGISTRDDPPYDIGLREHVIDDYNRVKRFAIAYKQQYVWGKFGKSCGLTIQQANDVFDTSIAKVGYDAKRVVDTVVFLAKNIPFKDNLNHLRQNQRKQTVRNLT